MRHQHLLIQLVAGNQVQRLFGRIFLVLHALIELQHAFGNKVDVYNLACHEFHQRFAFVAFPSIAVGKHPSPFCICHAEVLCRGICFHRPEPTVIVGKQHGKVPHRLVAVGIGKEACRHGIAEKLVGVHRQLLSVCRNKFRHSVVVAYKSYCNIPQVGAHRKSQNFLSLFKKTCPRINKLLLAQSVQNGILVVGLQRKIIRVEMFVGGIQILITL